MLCIFISIDLIIVAFEGLYTNTYINRPVFDYNTYFNNPMFVDTGKHIDKSPVDILLEPEEEEDVAATRGNFKRIIFCVIVIPLLIIGMVDI